LAEREAELLPVEYFHIVYTLPAPIADIAYQNKRVVYDLLMKASAQTTLAIAAEPRVLSCSCPRCGGRMIVIEVFARGCAPRYRPAPVPTPIRIDTS
jgi:hypothetical protein